MSFLVIDGKDKFRLVREPLEYAFGTTAKIVTLMSFITLVVYAAWSGTTIATVRDNANTLLTNNAPVPIIASECAHNETGLDARRTAAYQKRVEVALTHLVEPFPCHYNNGDEDLYASQGYFASFSKGLQHDSLGHVNVTSYSALLRAVRSGAAADFDAIPLAGSLKLVNPQAGLTFVLEGKDPRAFFVPPAPTFASAEAAAELVELFWMALARDVRFDTYSTDPIALAAIAELSSLSDYRGAPPSPSTLFRGLSPGCATGPLISQFMYKDVRFGAMDLSQRIYPYQSGLDFLTSFSDFLNVQNGGTPTGTLTVSPTSRYMITGRDLAAYVHRDVLFQAYFTAALWLMQNNAPLKPNIPYTLSTSNQLGFGTWGHPHIASEAIHSALHALRSIWWQKWFVHRRLRPEVFAARLDRHKNGFYTYPLHADLVNSTAAAQIYTNFGSWLLPQAFPEGSPAHPSYGSGHACVAGAAVTVLKALYDEDYVIPNPVQPNALGTALNLYPGTLTLSGELNKLAWNVAIGRNMAGVHYLSDSLASLNLGQEVAIEILRDMKTLFPEKTMTFTFRDFEGNARQV